MFGQSMGGNQGNPSTFGSSTSVFGSTPATTTPSLFPQTQPQTFNNNAFGAPAQQPGFGSSALFGNTASSTNPSQGFGTAAATGSAFGSTPGTSMTFGTSATANSAFGAGSNFNVANPGFGSSGNAGNPGFGSSGNAGNPGFGAGGNMVTGSQSVFGGGAVTTTTSSTGGAIFGASSTMNTGSGFGSSSTTSLGMTTSAPPFSSSSSMFGSSAPAPAFGSTGAMFGQSATGTGTGFGQTRTTNAPTTGPIFGQLGTTTSGTSGGSVFGAATTTTSSTTFGLPSTTSTTAPQSFSTFGNVKTNTTTTTSNPFQASAVFGGTSTNVPSQGSAIFGGTSTNVPSQGSSVGFPPQPAFGMAATTTSVFPATSTTTLSQANPVSTASGMFRGSQNQGSGFGGSMFTGQPTSTTSSKSVFTAEADKFANVFGKSQDDSDMTLGGVDSDTGDTAADAGPVRSLFRNIVEQTKPDEEERRTIHSEAKPEGKVKVLFGKQVQNRTVNVKEDRNLRRSPTPGPSSDPPGSPERRRILKRDPRASAMGPGKARGLFGAALSGLAKDTDTKKQTENIEKKDETSEEPEKGDLSEKIQRRRSTLEDMQSKVAIVCKNVHESCNNKDILRGHFGKFGRVKRVFPNPGKQTAIIHFETHEEAQKALFKGRVVDPDLPKLQIFWSSHTPRLSSVSSGDKLSALPAVTSMESRLTRSSRPPTGDLDDELAAMRGTSDLQGSKSSSAFTRRRSEDDPAKKRGRRLMTASALAKTDKKLSPLKAKKAAATVRSKVEKKTSSKAGSGHVSLRNLRDATGHSAAERYEILDNRDKIIKMTMGDSKQRDLATATAIKGTCQDMCPEKERYVREDRRRLSLYEIIPGSEMTGQNPQVDHARTIKEYSRSSADQDMPLPHELRPPAVLSMTMTYLLNNFMELGGDGKWADWYEYMWSRTRSLRKDITQQHLCDLTTVDVIEKNCRFHIYCAERLCEEDMSTFDEKINSENLTKCLQTLKEMYWDLEKNGVTCPHEAEFRAYIVLMNLNEGDTIREVQQLREDIRESPAVKFATSVYFALNRNNYIRFIKLVRRAPFMYACIMHRYFSQVRGMALRTMLKAYRWPSQNAQYSLSELVRLFGFENLQDAALFCQHHGLAVSEDRVYMEKQSFVFPETTLTPNRAQLLIESKLTTSLGEAINGGLLPPNVIHQPKSSFDESGRFVGAEIELASETRVEPEAGPPEPRETITAAAPVPAATTTTAAVDTGESISTTVSTGIFRPIPPLAPPVEEKAPPAAQYSAEAIKEVAREMFLEVINELVQNLAKNYVQSIQYLLSSCADFYNEMAAEVTHNLIRSLCEESMEETRREQQARVRAELSSIKSTITSALATQLISHVVLQECTDIAESQIRQVQQQLTLESRVRVERKVLQELVDTTVQEETCSVAESVFESDVIQRLQEIDEARRATQLLVCARMLRAWRNKYADRQRLKRSIQTFPPTPSMLTSAQQVAVLIPDSEGICGNFLHLGMSALTTLDSASKVEEREVRLKYNMTLYSYWKQRRRERAWAPVDLGTTFFRNLLKCFHVKDKHFKSRTIYWKLLLSLPDVGPNSSLDDDYTQHTIQCCDWLRAKFRKGTVPNPDSDAKTEVLALYKSSVSLPPSPMAGSLGVCVRVVRGFPEDQDEALDRAHLLGTSAVMFYVGEVGPDNSQFYVDEVQSRLLHLLEPMPKSSPVPLIILRSEQSIVTEDNLEFQMFIDEGMISSVVFFTLTDDIEDEECNKQFYEHLLYCGSHSPRPPRLSSEPLRDFLDRIVTQEFFTPVFQNLSTRQKQGILHQSPELLIGYYNHLIQHMADTVSESSLQEASWPVAEFSLETAELPSADWNAPESLDHLYTSLLDLQLPQFDGQDSDDWESVLQDVWSYVAAVVEDGEGAVILYSRVRWILRKVERQFQAVCKTSLRLDECEPEGQNLPWTDLIQACVEHRLSQACVMDANCQYEDRELLVHYYEAKMNRYRPPTDWLDTTLGTRDDLMSLHDTIQRSAKRKLEESSQSSYSSGRPVFKKHNPTASPLDLSSVNEADRSVADSAHRLNNLLAVEKQNNDKFEQFLQKSLLEENDLDSTVFHQTFGATIHAIAERTPIATKPTEDRRRTPGNRTELSSKGTTVSEELGELQQKLSSQRQADTMFEMRLKSFLTDV